MENAYSLLARQEQKLDVVENIRRLRALPPQGRRTGLARHQLRMRLPFAIFVLDDGREVLLDRRFRPILERSPGATVATPTLLKIDDVFSQKSSGFHLYDDLQTPQKQLAIAEAALRYLGVEPSETEINYGAP